jgi:hypothetical protein
MAVSDSAAAEAIPDIDTNADSPAVATSVFISLLLLLGRLEDGCIRGLMSADAGTEWSVVAATMEEAHDGWS